MSTTCLLCSTPSSQCQTLLLKPESKPLVLCADHWQPTVDRMHQCYTCSSLAVQSLSLLTHTILLCEDGRCQPTDTHSLIIRACWSCGDLTDRSALFRSQPNRMAQARGLCSKCAFQHLQLNSDWYQNKHCHNCTRRPTQAVYDRLTRTYKLKCGSSSCQTLSASVEGSGHLLQFMTGDRVQPRYLRHKALENFDWLSSVSLEAKCVSCYQVSQLQYYIQVEPIQFIETAMLVCGPACYDQCRSKILRNHRLINCAKARSSSLAERTRRAYSLVSTRDRGPQLAQLIDWLTDQWLERLYHQSQSRRRRR